MSSDPAPPRRRFTVQIQVTGDEWKDVAFALEDLLVHVQAHGEKCSTVSGGVSSGHWVQVIEDPEMTPERYREALEAYVVARHEAP